MNAASSKADTSFRSLRRSRPFVSNLANFFRMCVCQRSREHLMLVTARSGDGQALRCDDSHQRQHHDPRIERPSTQTATHACLRYKSHHQRGPSRSYLSCAGDHNEIQTAKSAIFAPDASAAANHRGRSPRPDQLSPVALL